MSIPGNLSPSLALLPNHQSSSSSVTCDSDDSSLSHGGRLLPPNSSTNTLVLTGWGGTAMDISLGTLTPTYTPAASSFVYNYQAPYDSTMAFSSSFGSIADKGLFTPTPNDYSSQFGGLFSQAATASQMATSSATYTTQNLIMQQQQQQQQQPLTAPLPPPQADLMDLVPNELKTSTLWGCCVGKNIVYKNVSLEFILSKDSAISKKSKVF